MENRPLWYEMLTTYKEWMGLHTGITIPCMIGAYYEADHSLNLTTPQCLEVILSSILEARIPVKIFRCSDINTDIISLVKETDISTYKGINPHINHLIYLNNNFGGHKDFRGTEYEFQTVASILYASYAQIIQDKCFSYTNGEWHPFDDGELSMIHRIVTFKVE